MTLRELRQGQTARIETVDAKQPGVVRLMVLGLIEAVEVQHANSAIGGDPTGSSRNAREAVCRARPKASATAL